MQVQEMSCYAMVIKNKSHKQVTDVLDKVISNKKTPEWAAKELGLSDHQFKELYEDVTSKLILI
jgi:hypothetical protein